MLFVKLLMIIFILLFFSVKSFKAFSLFLFVYDINLFIKNTILTGYNDPNERYIIIPQLLYHKWLLLQRRKTSSADIISNTSLLPLLSTLFCVPYKRESTPIQLDVAIFFADSARLREQKFAESRSLKPHGYYVS